MNNRKPKSSLQTEYDHSDLYYVVLIVALFPLFIVRVLGRTLFRGMRFLIQEMVKSNR